MTTWQDVAKDAIDAAKIIVPAGITALAALFVALVTKSFEWLSSTERERRERRLSLLKEASSEIHGHAYAWDQVYGVVLSILDSEPGDGIQYEGRLEDALKVAQAHPATRLFHIAQDAAAMGMQRCSESLSAIASVGGDRHTWKGTTVGEVLVLQSALMAKAVAAMDVIKETFADVEGRSMRERVNGWTQGWRP